MVMVVRTSAGGSSTTIECWRTNSWIAPRSVSAGDDRNAKLGNEVIVDSGVWSMAGLQYLTILVAICWSPAVMPSIRKPSWVSRDEGLVTHQPDEVDSDPFHDPIDRVDAGVDSTGAARTHHQRDTRRFGTRNKDEQIATEGLPGGFRLAGAEVARTGIG